MARSVWKGPFVEESLIKKVEKIKNDPNRKPIKTWSRKSTIIPDFVGLSFLSSTSLHYIGLLPTQLMFVIYVWLTYRIRLTMSV